SQRNGTPQQGSPEHEASSPTHGRDDLESQCLIAPDEPVPFLDLSPEEILVLSCQKLGSKWPFASLKESLLQEYVVSPSLLAVDLQSGRVTRTLVELACYDPMGRPLLKVRLDRTNDSLYPVVSAG